MSTINKRLIEKRPFQLLYFYTGVNSISKDKKAPSSVQSSIPGILQKLLHVILYNTTLHSYNRTAWHRETEEEETKSDGGNWVRTVSKKMMKDVNSHSVIPGTRGGSLITSN
jgi:hypothetical protein